MKLTIEQAAINYVTLRNSKLELKRKRANLLRDLKNPDAHECCMEHEDGCYQAMRDGQLNDPTQFCDFCSKIHTVCIEYQHTSDKASGALRTLSNTVKRALL